MLKKLKCNVKKTPIYWRVERAILLGGVTMQCAMTPIVSYALGKTQLVSGTKNLLNDVTLILCGIEAAVVAVCEIVEGLKWKLGPEEKKPSHIQNMKSILGVGVFCICVTGIVPAVFSYYTTPAKEE